MPAIHHGAALDLLPGHPWADPHRGSGAPCPPCLLVPRSAAALPSSHLSTGPGVAPCSHCLIHSQLQRFSLVTLPPCPLYDSHRMTCSTIPTTTPLPGPSFPPSAGDLPGAQARCRLLWLRVVCHPRVRPHEQGAQAHHRRDRTGQWPARHTVGGFRVQVFNCCACGLSQLGRQEVRWGPATAVRAAQRHGGWAGSGRGQGWGLPAMWWVRRDGTGQDGIGVHG